MILEVQNGCFGYPKQPVILESINLSLEEGHILAILGPNGIGKTTLLKCMIGLLPWHSGKTLLYGKDIHTLKPKDVWSTISYIPQSRGFAFSYTGLEMVLLGRSAHLGAFQQPGKEEIEMAEAMMERVGITRLANKDFNRMSGGELQMVLIARALINEPKLIILDEPETGLDFHNQILVLNMVERLAHESGISAIIDHIVVDGLEVFPGDLQGLGHALLDGDAGHHDDELLEAVGLVQLKDGTQVPSLFSSKMVRRYT